MQQALNKQLYFLAQRWRKEPVKSALLDLEKSLYCSLDELENIQNSRLIALLNHAIETVPFYKKHYAEYSGVIKDAKADTVKEIFTSLPILSKADILKNRDLFYSSKTYSCYTNVSSGTTGEPFTYPCDHTSWAYRHASLIRLIEFYGVKFGSRYGYFFGQHWKSEFQLKTKLKDWFFNRDRVSAFNINPSAVDALLKAFKRNRTVYLLGYPSVLVEFFKIAIEELNFNSQELNIKLIIATGETLESFQKIYLESIFNCPVVNYYGSSEGGFGGFVGAEGLMQENMETSVLTIEKHDKISKTDLFLRQFPLIKIQTDDVCKISLGNPNTKLKHRVLGEISGRTGDKIMLPSGKQVHSVILDYFFDLFINDPNVLKFRFEFYTDKVELLIKSQKAALDVKFVERILLEFKNLFPDDSLDVKKVDEIPYMANGKNRPWVQF